MKQYEKIKGNTYKCSKTIQRLEEKYANRYIPRFIDLKL
jgi:hypothetical protein